MEDKFYGKNLFILEDLIKWMSSNVRRAYELAVLLIVYDRMKKTLLFERFEWACTENENSVFVEIKREARRKSLQIFLNVD